MKVSIVASTTTVSVDTPYAGWSTGKDGSIDGRCGGVRSDGRDDGREGGDKMAWTGNVAGGELPYDVDVAGGSAPD